MFIYINFSFDFLGLDNFLKDYFANELIRCVVFSVLCLIELANISKFSKMLRAKIDLELK